MLISNYEERETRRERNRQRAISFLASETWTTPRMLQFAMSCSKGSVYKLLKQLRRDGLVRDHKINDLRLSIVGATPHCIAIAASQYGLAPTLPTLQPAKVKPLSVAHKLDLQRARILAECAGWDEWTLARDLPRRWTKYPEATALASGGHRIAIELERTVRLAEGTSQ